MKSYPDSLSSLRRRYRKVRIPDWTGLVSLPLAFLSYLLLDVTLRYLFDGAGAVPASSFPPWLFSVMWALIFTSVAALLPRHRDIRLCALGDGVYVSLHGDRLDGHADRL